MTRGYGTDVVMLRNISYCVRERKDAMCVHGSGSRHGRDPLCVDLDRKFLAYLEASFMRWLR